MDWHSLRLSEVLKELNASENGLTIAEAQIRLKAFGHNKLKEKPPKPLWMRFLAEFNNFLIWILIFAATVSLALGEVLDGLAILAIVVLFAFFGFFQEYRAEKAILALKKLAILQATVFRDGKEHRLSAADLVPGDVILLAEGTKIPADVRLLEAYDLKAEEAALTGESLPVTKDASLQVAGKSALGDRKNCLYLGTSVTRGAGKAVVVATGMKTELGKIAQLVQDVEEPPTPLQIKLEELGKRLGSFALGAVVVIFLVGFLAGIPLFKLFLMAVALAVAAVPEGLPAVVTITLAVGVTRMAKRNSLIRKLPAVETLGSTTVICTDKTGTLTKNQMTVRSLYLNGREEEVTGSGYLADGRISGKPSAELDLLLKACCLCNSSALTPEGVVGDPTEVALLSLAKKGGLDFEKARKEFPSLSQIPFSSERKMMSTVNRVGKDAFVFSKGAPEILLQKCTRILDGGKIRPLAAAKRASLLEQNGIFAAQGLRVLAFSYKEIKDKPEEEMVFLALAALNDPPRPEVRDSIALCKEAGIRVVMITGDNPLTAKSIARELGLDADLVLTGPELDEMLSGDKLLHEVRRTSIFARVSPEHKLNIVQALKSQGHVVAVTGDGVNDAPAIKAGDIGVAMGITGTDVTKETADMVITDDNFASIVNAVEEGRTVYDNIVKSVTYLVSCNIGEILTVLFAILLGATGILRTDGISEFLIPLAPLQILWMNLATDLLPAAALSVDPKLPDSMKRLPRKANEEVLGRSRMVRAFAVGTVMMMGTLGLYAYFLAEGHAKAATVAFTTLIFFQLFFAISSRSEHDFVGKLGWFSNRYLWAALLVSGLMQVAIVQWPPAQSVFETVPLSGPEWLLSLAVGASVLVFVEILKSLKKWG